MNKRTLVSIGLGIVSVACATRAFEGRPAGSSIQFERAEQPGEPGRIAGFVRDVDTEQLQEGALAVLQCDCLEGTRETQSNANGLFMFGDLPPGSYTLEVLHGTDAVTMFVELREGSRVRVSVEVSQGQRVIIT